MSGKIDIFNVAIDDVDEAGAVHRIMDLVREGRPRFVWTPNVQHVVLALKDAEFQKKMREAALVVPDGMPIVWMSRWNRTPFKERVTGVDLVPAICAAAARERKSVYFFGAEPGVADEVAQKLKQSFPELQVAGASSPSLGFENNDEENRLEIEKIRKARPDILFVALGTPKQELWIHRHLQELGVPVCMGVGAAFNFIAGREKRPPKWLRDHGLEGVVRFFYRPREIGRRLLHAAPIFLAMLLDLRTYVFQKRLLSLAVFLAKAMGDAAVVGATYGLCHFIRFNSPLFDWLNRLAGYELFPVPRWPADYFMTLFAYLMVVTVLCFYTQRLYERHLDLPVRELALRVFRGWTFALFVLFALAFMGGSEMREQLGSYARSTLILTWILGSVLLIAWRLLWERLRRWMRIRGIIAERLLVIGADEKGREFIQRLSGRPELGIRAVGYLDEDPALQGKEIEGVPVLGRFDDFFAVARSRKVDLAIVASPNLKEDDLRRLQRDANRADVAFAIVPNALALLAQRTVLSVVGGLTVLRILR